MDNQLYRDTWAEVDLQAIEENVKAMKESLPENTEIMAVVKANGYGHGSVAVAKRALAAGATCLAVALLEEAMTLRQAKIDVPILVMGWVDARHAALAAEHNISLTMFQTDWLDQVPANLSKPLKVHMKWDTGMGRIGIRRTEEIEPLLAKLAQYDQIQLTGIFTHFASADGEDLDYYEEQRRRFEEMLQGFRRLSDQALSIHVGNSAASIRFPENMYQFVRYGIAMYGLYPSEAVKREEHLALKPALSLHTRLSHVKQIQAGESVGYGQTYVAEKEEWIGTLPIGYADGWSRQLQGFQVLVEGKKMPIVGRICMDQMMIKLDQAYPLSTKVTLIGRQNEAEITADDVADYLGTINYEIPCMLTQRIPRIYPDEGA